MNEELVRVQKYLASVGIASRRACEEYIKQGLVEVNGETLTELGTKIDPSKDIVKFKGRIIENKNLKYVYVLLNKPIRLCDNSKRPI